eukprot:gene1008-1533_t
MDRVPVGPVVGEAVDAVEKETAGEAVEMVGKAVVGEAVGDMMGGAVGEVVGEPVDDTVGGAVGEVVGEPVGDTAGEADGYRVRLVVGAAVGARVGVAEGELVDDCAAIINGIMTKITVFKFILRKWARYVAAGRSLRSGCFGSHFSFENLLTAVPTDGIIRNARKHCSKRARYFCGQKEDQRECVANVVW